MTHRPTTELVAIAWLKGITGLPGGQIGTTLPADVSKWPDGFVQVLTVGGSPDIYVPIRQPVVSIDFWAGSSSGNKAPWGKANALAELVRDACYTGTQREVAISVGDYQGARVLTVYPTTEPRRVLDDVAGYAHYSMDVLFHWVPLENA